MSDKSVGIPLWFKIFFTVFSIVILLMNIFVYSWTNVFWFSHTAVFLMLFALWTESSLIGSMAGVGILFFHIFWSALFFIQLLTGLRIGALNYMFDSSTPMFLRAVSLFHVGMPPLIIWFINNKGYDPRALKYQTGLGVVLIFFSYLLSSLEANINWVFGPVKPQNAVPQPLYFLIEIVMIPALVYLPTHKVLKENFEPNKQDL